MNTRTTQPGNFVDFSDFARGVHTAVTSGGGCCCCLHIKSRSGLYSVLSNIRTGPTDADAFRGHRLTTQEGYTYQKKIKGPRKVNTHAIIGK